MVAFSIFWRDIYRYGIMYLLSFVIWYIVLYYIGKSNVLKNYPKAQKALTQDIDTILIITILWVMLWWRLGYVVIYDRSYFMQHPSEILAIRHGGMSFIGWMIGVCTAIGIRGYKEKWKTDDFLSIFDSILAIAPLGIILWRIGNFLNQEIYGIPVPADFRWLGQSIVNRANKRQLFHIYDTIDAQLRVNTNFLAAFFEWALMLCICWGIMLYYIHKKNFRPRTISAVFIIGYGFIRFFLEYLRVDSQSEFIGRLTKSQYFFVWFVIIGTIILVTRPKKS